MTDYSMYGLQYIGALFGGSERYEFGPNYVIIKEGQLRTISNLAAFVDHMWEFIAATPEHKLLTECGFYRKDVRVGHGYGISIRYIGTLAGEIFLFWNFNQCRLIDLDGNWVSIGEFTSRYAAAGKIPVRVNALEAEVADLRAELAQLRGFIAEHFAYAPGGVGAAAAQAHFEEMAAEPH